MSAMCKTCEAELWQTDSGAFVCVACENDDLRAEVERLRGESATDLKRIVDAITQLAEARKEREQIRRQLVGTREMLTHAIVGLGVAHHGGCSHEELKQEWVKAAANLVELCEARAEVERCTEG